MRKHILVVMIVILILVLATVAMAADPIIGTWKLNIAKSKPAPGQQPVKELTVASREVGTEIETTFEGIGADGSPFSMKFINPQQGGVLKSGQAPTEGTFIVLTVIGPGEMYGTSVQNGKQVDVTHTVVSKDGKTLSRASKTMDAQGKINESLMVFDKQ